MSWRRLSTDASPRPHKRVPFPDCAVQASASGVGGSQEPHQIRRTPATLRDGQALGLAHLGQGALVSLWDQDRMP